MRPSSFFHVKACLLVLFGCKKMVEVLKSCKITNKKFASSK